MKNEAHARIKINKLLEEAGWKFYDDENGSANILLENHVKITQTEVDAWGNEFDKFISIYPPEEDVNLRALNYIFKAYIVDQDIRQIIETKDFHALQTHPTLTISQFKAVANKYREVIPVYIKDYIDLERFAA